MKGILPVFLEILTSADPPGQTVPEGGFSHGTEPLIIQTSSFKVALNGRSEMIVFFPYTGTRTASATAFATSGLGTNPSFGMNPLVTRGYTWGFIAEYQSKAFDIRFGEMLVPKVANGIDLDWNLRRARAENVELELHRSLVAHREGIVRVLSYVNHANMGDYREAVARFRAGIDAVPTVENTRQQGRIKYGFGINDEQALTDSLRVFVRWGWNEGRHESFAYTEVNSTVSFGGDYAGTRWGRKLDKVGAALVSNGISKDHQQYLRLGGRGFLLGDGALN